MVFQGIIILKLHSNTYIYNTLGDIFLQIHAFFFKRETYQRAMNYIFHDYMHDIVEAYMDDLLAKYPT